MPYVHRRKPDGTEEFVYRSNATGCGCLIYIAVVALAVVGALRILEIVL